MTVGATAPNTSLSSEALAGKVALITGAGTGIGRATALSMAACGADLILVGRRKALLEETAAACQAFGSKSLVISCDVREAEQVSALLDEALQAMQRIDILVNNAGGQFQAPAEEISLNGWRAVHRLSVEAVWNMTNKVAVRSMIPNRSGAIIFLGFSPHRGIPGLVHASAARAAIENLSFGLALEWSKYGIRSLTVAPGTIVSEGLEQYTEESRRQWEQGVPLGRLGEPRDIAEVITFLTTDAARYITGTTIDIDGGSNAWGSGYPAPSQEVIQK